MMRLAGLIRRNAFKGMEELVRGPKKKKGESVAKIESTDIVNIFKEREDPQISDIKNYPIYVQELSRGYHSVHQFYIGIQHDINYMKPGRANLKGYLKAWKRQRAKAMNQYRHLDGKPDIMSDNDIIHRRAVYDVGRLGAEEEAERLKQQEEEELAAMEEDDEE